MLEAFGDLWSYIGKVDILFITTNLEVKNNGRAVMGRGCAHEALTRWPNIDDVLGRSLTQSNFNPIPLWRIHPATQLWSFPTKGKGRILQGDQIQDRVITRLQGRYQPGSYVPSWAQRSTMDRIEDSARYIQAMDFKSAVIARPGVGNGELSWPEVSNLLNSILDDRVTSITWR